MNELNNIPANWKWVSLEDIGIIVSGGTPSTREPEFWNGEIPWITPADLSNYNDIYISKGQRNISQIGLEYSSAILLPENSVVFSSRAPIGYVAITKGPMATNQGFKNLIVKNDLINSKYVFYYLKTVKELAENMASGTTFLELSGAKFKQIPFPLPPIEEQNRIVNKIDEVFSIINDSLKSMSFALEKAQIYVDKIIHGLYHGSLNNLNEIDNLPENWEWKKLKDIGQIINGGTPKTKVAEYWHGDIPWVTPADLSNYKDVYISYGSKYITNLGLENSSAKLVPKGSILFSSRAPIGYVAVAKNDITTNQGFKTIVPFENINCLYVYYFLKSIKSYANKIASGTTFLELSTEKFKEIPIPIPLLEDQNKIVTEIEEAQANSDSLIKELLQQIRKADNTKGKILHDAFQGKLLDQLSTDSSVDDLLQKLKDFNTEYIKEQNPATKRTKSIRVVHSLKTVIEVNFKDKFFRLEDIIELNLFNIENLKNEWNLLLDKGFIKKVYDKQKKLMQFTKQ